jgi:hypothetical protein
MATSAQRRLVDDIIRHWESASLMTSHETLTLLCRSVASVKFSNGMQLHSLECRIWLYNTPITRDIPLASHQVQATFHDYNRACMLAYP